MRNGWRALITQSRAAAIIAAQQTIKGTGRMRLNALSDSVTRNNAKPKTTTARRNRSRRPSREGIARTIAAKAAASREAAISRWLFLGRPESCRDRFLRAVVVF